MATATATSAEEAVDKALEGNTEKKERAQKPVFSIETAVDKEGKKLDADKNARMAGVPYNWTPEFKPCSRNDFADIVHFLNYKGRLYDLKATAMTAKADEYRAEAVVEANGGDPTAKKIKAANKLKSNLAKLLAELEATGADVSDLL